MFTGIIEEVGRVIAVKHGANSARITIEAALVSQDARLGDSIAINGTCLTVVERQAARLTFDAVPETIDCTNLKGLRAGELVNLERALAVGQRFGGHFVQGHVDGAATLREVTARDNAKIVRVGVEPGLMRYVVPKGSVALDGISLTVIDVTTDGFSVSVIPHTYANTTLCNRRIGDKLNIETDLIARHIERFVNTRTETGGLTEARLAQEGFL